MTEREIGPTEALRRVALFASLRPPELEQLARCVRSQDYGRDQVIFLEGDVGTALGVIASGRVRICLTGIDGRQVVLNVYGPGEFFGEFALLDGEPRSADAVAQEPCRLFWLRRDDFLAFVEAHPRAAATLLAVLSRRLRHTTRVVHDAALRDVPARVARVLLDLAESHGRPSPSGVVVDVRLTQAELAAMVGATRETVNRALRSFERLNLLRYERNSVTVLRTEELR